MELAVRHPPVSKTVSAVQPWRPGMLKLWIEAYNVWHSGSDSSYVEPTPKLVKDKTEQVLAGGAFARVLREFLGNLAVVDRIDEAASLHELTQALFEKLQRYGVTDSKRCRSLLRLWLVENADGSVSQVGSSQKLAVKPAMSS